MVSGTKLGDPELRKKLVEGGAKAAHSGLLLCRADALTHGIFLWYGDGNVYDKRLHYVYAAASDSIPPQVQPLGAWANWWSCDKDIALIYEGKPPPQLDLANPSSVERLHFSPRV